MDPEISDLADFLTEIKCCANRAPLPSGPAQLWEQLILLGLARGSCSGLSSQPHPHPHPTPTLTPTPTLLPHSSPEPPAPGEGWEFTNPCFVFHQDNVLCNPLQFWVWFFIILLLRDFSPTPSWKYEWGWNNDWQLLLYYWGKRQYISWVINYPACHDLPGLENAQGAAEHPGRHHPRFMYGTMCCYSHNRGLCIIWRFATKYKICATYITNPYHLSIRERKGFPL